MSSIITEEKFGILANPLPVRDEPYAALGRDQILSLAGLQRAATEIRSWTGYKPTPLHSLDGLAKASRVSKIFYKDEGSRFGLGSFKALGGAYAVFALLRDEVHKATGVTPNSREMAKGAFLELTSKVTVTCATDGNHGRSVAWGARTFGCRCIIYVHETVSKARQEAIAAYGAEVRVIPGNYDNAVRQAAVEAAANGWFTVSDTSYEGYTEIPRDVMQGYGVALDESYSQLPEHEWPTHVFVQAGVGGVAASFCSYLWERFGAAAPTFVVVEPVLADCVIRTVREGRPTADEGALNTIMAGLACGEISILAWEILRNGLDAVLTISDDAARETMRLLAEGRFGDQKIVAVIFHGMRTLFEG